MKPLVAIVGPTAVGKSALALRLALELQGEIVSADSRQVYRGLDIGTAKPTPEERNLAPHHLIDVVEPDEEFTLAHYLALAQEAIADIQARERLPLLVGGSGLYVWSLLEGLRPPQVPPNPERRRHLEERAAQEGNEALYQELQAVDPQAAARIDPRNLRRVIRALEVYQETGIPFSRLGRREPPPYDALIIGLTMSREELYRRIDARVDAMMERGLVDEVRGLLARYSKALPALSSLGYRQMVESALGGEGRRPLAEAVARIKTQTHRYARQQYAWFRLDDERIRWFDMSQTTVDSVVGLAGSWLSDMSRK